MFIVIYIHRHSLVYLPTFYRMCCCWRLPLVFLLQSGHRHWQDSCTNSCRRSLNITREAVHRLDFWLRDLRQSLMWMRRRASGITECCLFSTCMMKVWLTDMSSSAGWLSCWRKWRLLMTWCWSWSWVKLYEWVILCTICSIIFVWWPLILHSCEIKV